MGYNTLIVLLGTCLLGAVSGMVGSFTVLRRRALIGDALSHAALPGLCLAYLLLHRRSLPGLLLGALMSGVLGVAIVSALRKSPRVREDAAIGIVLSVFYGAGIALSSIIQRQPGGNSAGLNRYILGSTASMIRQDVIFIAAVGLLCAAMVILFFKEFKLISFDPDFAQVQGWPVTAIDLGMMAMVALTVVIGLPAVGAIMMAALMIIPAAAARFWTNRLGFVLLVAGVLGAATGAAGTWLTARYSRLPAGPAIVLVGACIFLLSMLAAPTRGVVAQWLRQREFNRQLVVERLLAALHEQDGAASMDWLLRARSWTPRQLRRVLEFLRRDGLATPTDEGWALTANGRRAAQRVAQAVRIWRLFLTEYPELAGSITELSAERLDESLPPEILRELNARLCTTSDREAGDEQ